MKFEWIGCCFRIELEWFDPTVEPCSLRISSRSIAEDTKRKLWREIRGKLKTKRPFKTERQLRPGEANRP